MQKRTIPWLFESSVNRFSQNPLIWEKRTDSYHYLTYRQMQELVHQFAAGLLSMGVKKGERIALISEGRNYWLMSELGVLYCGAISVPISVKINELSDLKFRLAHSGSRVVIVSGQQAHKIDKIKNDLPELEKVILLDARESYESDEILVDEVLARGKEFLKNEDGRKRLNQTWQAIEEDDYATIMYSSGTTADPKGVILSHKNYVVNTEQSLTVMDIPPYFVTLLILPWDHAFAHTVGLYTLIKNGASMAAVQSGKTQLETLKNIPKNLKEIRPHFLLSVPALAKNFRKNIEKAIRDKGKATERLFQQALKIAYLYNGEGWNKGKGFRKVYKPLYALYDKVLFRKIRDSFGGRLQFFIGGGALLDIEMQRFFYAIGIPMFQGYGLTEAAPVISSNKPHEHKLGTSGKVLKGMEVKIVDERGNELPTGQRGEICVKGENVMVGYWKNPTATENALRDGWLHTGDLGYLDEEGYLYVLGREKSLLIGNDGEKYSPEGIEEAILDHSPYIDQIMLYNNQSPYTIALVVPNKAAVIEWARENNVNFQTEEGQCAVIKLIEEEIDKFKPGGKYAGLFPSRWLPATFAILGEGFTEQNRLLNSTLKMVRPRIVDYYRNRIDYLYTAEGKNVCNEWNKRIVKRMSVKGEDELSDQVMQK
ncbi:AMP-dependent synthetase and ligase [Caldithrix abyssi DSM 13497]|uniref:AMP-dependent synthetase and ligase n=1 Tax=Caldithrix abyssi DSM 13497 TaxID=880073 RepID=H1XVU6_CALAY|nr:AMP-binding protein [Caldithrix abyssi]APF20849.1 long-chain acyl-CoA synthetase [Caldithrix abyssi DSM 13497]EHO40673.1 AMP-dependent synthetase and ligase [Caldithrix abyssi DSM 13497]